jgi:stearoyl-CoA desaturase (delta-9 desaturase)
MVPATPRTANKAPGKIDLVTSIPFFAIHLLALGVLLVPFKWHYVAVAAGLYVVRMFGITAVFHRYFSHRSYKTSRWFQFVLAFIATTSAQKGALWWAAHHRHHHKYSDTPEDIHSPKQHGLWWAHVGWILSSKWDETQWDRIKDFARYPELRWLNKHHLVPPILLAAALWLIGGVPLVLWGFCLSTVFLWHGTFTINSLSHVFGKARYRASDDDSKNNWLLALITLGEGWHNNHHFYQSTANQGWFWWEVDLSYYALKVLSWLGLVWDLRTPPEHIKYAHKNPPVADAPAVKPVPVETSKPVSVPLSA